MHCEAEADRSDPVAETRWLDAQQRRYGFPNALVAWADLTGPKAIPQLEAHLAASALVRGIRFKPRLPEIGSRSTPAGGLNDPAFVAGVALLERYGLSWDLRVPWWHLEAAARVVAQIRSTAVILNHCGLPWQRDPESMAVWRSGMQALAACPNVTVKLSELGLGDTPWSDADNVAILRQVLDLFGPSRAIFASNFPVAGMRVGYDRWVAAVDSALKDFAPEDRAAVLCGNAMRVYRIDPLYAVLSRTPRRIGLPNRARPLPHAGTPQANPEPTPKLDQHPVMDARVAAEPRHGMSRAYPLSAKVGSS